VVGTASKAKPAVGHGDTFVVAEHESVAVVETWYNDPVEHR